MLSRLGYILLCLCTIAFNVWSQPDTVFNYPPEERSLIFYDWYIENGADRKLRLEEMQRLEKIAHDRKDYNLEQFIWALELDDKLVISNPATFEERVNYYHRLIKDAMSRNWDWVEAYLKFRLGNWLFDKKKFGEGMEMMMNSFQYLNETGWPSPVIAILQHQDIGHAFYRFGDAPTAIKFLKAAQNFEVDKKYKAYPYKSQNSLGLCYQVLTKYDSAIYYFKMSNDNAKLHNDTFWMSLTEGNMGYTYFKSGQVEKALPYLESDFNGSIRAGYTGSAVNAATLLANIELQKGNLKKAEGYIQFARTHLDTSSLESMVTYYDNLFTYSKLKGDNNTAVLYADSLQYYKDKKEKILDNHILDQAAIRVEVDKYANDIKQLQAARSRQVLMRNALFVILILASIIAYMWIKRLQLKRQADQEKLIHAQNELNSFTQSLVEKNELIQSFRDELEKMKESGAFVENGRSAHIGELMNSYILTDDDWRKFRQHFDVVYPGFLVRVKEKFTDLTPAETRLLALVKLQLPAKDMAEMLGISAETIYKTRYRLRKKINLPEDGSLEELVAII